MQEINIHDWLYEERAWCAKSIQTQVKLESVSRDCLIDCYYCEPADKKSNLGLHVTIGLRNWVSYIT